MFPVMKKLHEPQQWNRFIRQFMQQHRAMTPYFLQLPQEFLAFLQNEYEPRADDFPFLLELAHYEYIELALSISEAENDMSAVDTDGDLLTGVPVKSELAWLYAYQYPVHRISAEFLPSGPADTPVFLAVYRQPNDRVGFLELNPVSARLLEAVDANTDGSSGAELLRRIADEINYTNPDAFIEHGRMALDEMRGLDILIGTRVPDQGAR